MDIINQLLELDIIQWFYTGCILIAGLVTIATLLIKFFDHINVPIKWFKTRNKDHEILLQTVRTVSELDARQTEDTRQSIVHDKRIKDELSSFMNDMRQSVTELKSEQSEVVQSLLKITQSNKARDNATMEEMCDRIVQKTKHYINDLHGIPEDEYDDFVRLFHAYAGIGGNHGAEAKYKYCINQLKVLPVVTSIIKE